MRVVALDPGPVESAYVVWDGGIVEKGKYVNSTVRVILAGVCPRARVAIEQIQSYGMAVGREVFATCHEAGRFHQVAAAAGAGEIVLVPRRLVKLHLCHSTKAKDTNIRQALIDRLGAPGTRQAPGPTYGVTRDCWAALALAVCVADGINPTQN